MYFFSGGGGPPCGMWNSPRPGIKLCHGSDPNHCSDNAGSLTCCATRKLWNVFIFSKFVFPPPHRDSVFATFLVLKHPFIYEMLVIVIQTRFLEHLCLAGCKAGNLMLKPPIFSLKILLNCKILQSEDHCVVLCQLSFVSTLFPIVGQFFFCLAQTIFEIQITQPWTLIYVFFGLQANRYYTPHIL